MTRFDKAITAAVVVLLLIVGTLGSEMHGAAARINALAETVSELLHPLGV